MTPNQIWATWLCQARGHRWIKLYYPGNFRTCKTCGEPGWEV